MKKMLKASTLIAVFLAAATAAAPELNLVSTAKAQPLEVQKSHAKVYRVSRPAGTVIVGDPNIVKATMQDLKTLILTGKEYGSTNIIVLDTDGQPMIDELVIVQSNQESSVNVFTQTQVTTIACGKVCQPVETQNSTSR